MISAIALQNFLQHYVRLFYQPPVLLRQLPYLSPEGFFITIHFNAAIQHNSFVFVL